MVLEFYDLVLQWTEVVLRGAFFVSVVVVIIAILIILFDDDIKAPFSEEENASRIQYAGGKTMEIVKIERLERAEEFSRWLIVLDNEEFAVIERASEETMENLLAGIKGLPVITRQTLVALNQR